MTTENPWSQASWGGHIKLPTRIKLEINMENICYAQEKNKDTR
jgi:hypothetical protein